MAHLLIDGLFLFQNWCGLSDYELENKINDSLSFSYFLGMTIVQVAPNHNTLGRFRTELTKTKIYEKLFSSINLQLKVQHIIVKKRIIIGKIACIQCSNATNLK